MCHVSLLLLMRVSCSLSSVRYSLLVHSYYLGAHHAMNRGFTPIVAYLFDAVHGFIARGVPFVVPQPMIKVLAPHTCQPCSCAHTHLHIAAQNVHISRMQCITCVFMHLHRFLVFVYSCKKLPISPTTIHHVLRW